MIMGESIRVATVCQNGSFGDSVEENREYVLSLLDRALTIGPDLVVLPETFTTVSLDRDLEKNAESVPGPTTDACAKRAKKARTYVICPIQTKRDGDFWNSAVVIDREGQVVGIYDKSYPVTSTEDYTMMEYGMRPGVVPPPVFDLDFGRIGIQICFDVNYPESWEAFAEAGTKLVAWPSAYNGGFPLRAYAFLHHYFVVTSVRTDGSRIIDPLGSVRTMTDQRLTMVWNDLSLDYAVCHWDFNYRVPDEIISKYGDRVFIQSDRDSGNVLIETRDGSIDIDSLKTEFGFETSSEYYERHRRAYRELRDGRPAKPQQALHATRPQYAK